MKRAIVLSGGGGKGAYQIGVWKALRKLHIKFDIVTGTSVGALNGAYMVQQNYLKAIIAWRYMNFNTVFDTDFKEDIHTKEGKKELISVYAKGIVLDGGMEVNNLEELIQKTVNEERLRKSPIDYGFVTFNLTKLKARSMKKENIPKGKVKDYLLASATCYPIFKKKEIGNASFIDGGIYDNLPINLAIDMGADEIIAVDLKAPGIKQKVKNPDVKITTISPRNKIVPFLVFDKIEASRAIQLGYNDTMKTFDKLDGNKYTYKKNHLLKNYQIHYDTFIEMIYTFFHTSKNKSLLDNLLSISAFKKIFKESSEKEKIKMMNQTIEYLGKVFEMDESKIYNIRNYNRKLLDKLGIEDIQMEEKIKEIIQHGKTKGLLNTKIMIKYMYIKMSVAKENKDVRKELSSLALIFSKEFLGALYLYTITK